MPRKSSWFLAAAWIAFIVSLFLTAVDDDMTGWRCAVTCATMITELGEWEGIYYFAFTVPNVLMLFSPLLVYRLDQKPCKTKWLNVAALFCALYVLVFRIINWFSPGFDLKVGYYLWLASFWLLFLGFVFLKRGHQSEESPLEGREATA